MKRLYGMLVGIALGATVMAQPVNAALFRPGLRGPSVGAGRGIVPTCVDKCVTKEVECTKRGNPAGVCASLFDLCIWVECQECGGACPRRSGGLTIR